MFLFLVASTSVTERSFGLRLLTALGVATHVLSELDVTVPMIVL